MGQSALAELGWADASPPSARASPRDKLAAGAPEALSWRPQPKAPCRCSPAQTVAAIARVCWTGPQFLKTAAGSDGHARKRCFVDGHGKTGLLAETLINPAQERAAADEDKP
jgi:hypothetical protein